MVKGEGRGGGEKGQGRGARGDWDFFSANVWTSSLVLGTDLNC